MSDPAKWADLRVRAVSGLIVLALGLGAIWAGGLPVRLLAVVAAGLMLWELARLSAPGRNGQAIAIGALAGLSLAALLWFHGPYWLATFALAPVAGLLTPRRDRLVFALYAFAVMLAAYGVVAFREGYGLTFVIWLVMIVIASDVMGYFAGRIIGGPRFWPAVSPKKTWSGTVAGWAGAALVGLWFVAMAGQGPWLIAFSALTALAAQMGDIAESAIKRRAGVKDSSSLIPGHGGVLDRLDALIGAAVFVLAWGLAGLPVPAFGD
jgi:phosphatidate cytidylyltransferase